MVLGSNGQMRLHMLDSSILLPEDPTYHKFSEKGGGSGGRRKSWFRHGNLEKHARFRLWGENLRKIFDGVNGKGGRKNEGTSDNWHRRVSNALKSERGKSGS